MSMDDEQFEALKIRADERDSLRYPNPSDLPEGHHVRSGLAREEIDSWAVRYHIADRGDPSGDDLVPDQ